MRGVAKKLISYNEDADEGDRLPTQVRTEIEILAAALATGAINYLPFGRDVPGQWPVRPDNDLPTIWRGGAAPDNLPPIGDSQWDIWLPASGDGTPLGPTLTALQLIAATANRVPYFSADGVAALLTLSTDGTLAANSDTVIVSQKGLKTYVDAAIAARKTATEHLTTQAAKTGNYTFVLTDQGTVIPFDSSAGDATFTIPKDVFDVGHVLEVRSRNTSILSIAPVSGVTLNSEGNKRRLTGQWASATLHCTDVNVWYMAGSLIT